MSILTVVQNFCRLHGLVVPTSVINSQDTTVQQIYAALLDVLSETVQESKFQVLTQEALFTLTGTESQGAMTTLCPNGYQWAVNDTFYDRTRMLPLIGPMNEVEWQQLKALPNSLPNYKYRIRGGNLLINPVPSSSGGFSQIAFEYISSWFTTSVSGTAQATPLHDTDLFVFPEAIVAKGLAYRWKQIKGLPYTEDQTRYFDMLNNFVARNKTARKINVSEDKLTDVGPGIFVPSGNWNVR